MDKADFVSKIEWEGGIYDALEYGLKHTDLDEGEDDSLRSAWAEAEALYARLEQAIEAIESTLHLTEGE